MKGLGKLLRKAREDRGLTVHQVAGALDIAEGSIYRHEQGRKTPGEALMRAYAKLYGLRYEEARLVGPKR